LGAINVSSGANVTFEQTVTAASFTQAAGTGTTTFNGAQNYNTATGLNVVTDTIVLNAAVTTRVGGIVTLNANNNNAGAGAGTLTIAAAGDINSAGNVTLIGRLGITTSGDVTATSSNLTLGDASQTGAITQTAGSMTIGGATSIQTAGNVDLGSNSNDFIGAVTVQKANGITLRDGNALALGATTTTAGQVFVAGGTITTSGGHAISGSADMLLQSIGGGVTLGSGTTYTGRNITVAVGPNQSFINSAGSNPFNNNGGRTVVFSTETFLNQPTSLNAGLQGFQPYFQQSPVITTTGIGTYTVANTLPGGNLTVYSTPFSDNVPAGFFGLLTGTEAYQTSVPIGGYSLGALSRRPVQIQYRGGARARSPLGIRVGTAPEGIKDKPKGGTAELTPNPAPTQNAKPKFSITTGSLSLRPAEESEHFFIGNISIGSGQVTQVP
jgi:hypothetical protein